MGGQACVFYGAAEFSRDTDFAILASRANLERLQRALIELEAELIAVPPLNLTYLKKGHAIHFRCAHPEARGLRIYVMTRLRGVDPFPALWKRRTTIALPSGIRCDLLSLPDLTKAKKTQRDKDWPMIRRLVEANYFQHRTKPSRVHVNFWLRELRSPELLVETTSRFPAAANRNLALRPLLEYALEGDLKAIEQALGEEEQSERMADRSYWRPLKVELERLRHSRRPAQL
jgi:hypothetical protein